jgi:MmyB-like transcription regulator ligand binding domain
VQRILDGLTALPAIVLNGRLDLLAANRLGVAVYSPVYADPTRPVNLARFAFLNPRATALYPHWDDAANTPSPCCAPKPAASPTTVGYPT